MSEKCSQCQNLSVICCELFNQTKQEEWIYCGVCCPVHRGVKRGVVLVETPEPKVTGDDQDVTQDDFLMFCNEAAVNIENMSLEEKIAHKHNLMDAIRRLKIHVSVVIRDVRVNELEMTEAEKKRLMEYESKYKPKAKAIDDAKRKKTTANEQFIQLVMKEYDIDRDTAIDIIKNTLAKKQANKE